MPTGNRHDDRAARKGGADFSAPRRRGFRPRAVYFSRAGWYNYSNQMPAEETGRQSFRPPRDGKEKEGFL